MPIAKNGKFVRVQSTYIRIKSIVSVKPKELIHYDEEDRIVSKELPEIHIGTAKTSFAFLFHDAQQRDSALKNLLSILGE
ncbi:MAG: hypothetical protein EOO85_31145 [Pedobacter sp.]|nr:MAG: hypothetical protein EOO85_31145 [Pedobacter sp.]